MASPSPTTTHRSADMTAAHITFSAALLQQWRAVGIAQQLVDNDRGIAAFLLQLYDRWNLKQQCAACKKPLPLSLCEQCRAANQATNPSHSKRGRGRPRKREQRDTVLTASAYESRIGFDTDVLHSQPVQQLEKDTQPSNTTKQKHRQLPQSKAQSNSPTKRKRGRPPKSNRKPTQPFEVEIQNAEYLEAAGVMMVEGQDAELFKVEGQIEAVDGGKSQNTEVIEFKRQNVQVKEERDGNTQLTEFEGQNVELLKVKEEGGLKAELMVVKPEETMMEEEQVAGEIHQDSDLHQNAEDFVQDDPIRSVGDTESCSDKDLEEETSLVEETEQADVNTAAKSPFQVLRKCEGKPTPKVKSGRRRGRPTKPKVAEKEYSAECDYCKSVFKSSDVLQRHITKIHEKSRGKNWLFSCSECNVKFRTQGLLDAHKIRHSGQLPYGCALCKKAFIQPKQVAHHLRLEHASQEESLQSNCYQCLLCNKTYPTKTHLTKHAIGHFKVYKCDICPETFRSKGGLQSHKHKHEGLRPYVCSDCGLTFLTKSNLYCHTLTHTGKRPYNCPLCPATFVRSSHKTIHLLAHRGEKPHLCQICGASYQSQSSLSYHMNKHTGDTPFKCDECDKAFIHPSNLNSHRKRAHPAAKSGFVCNVCGLSCLTPKGLHKHKIFKHSDKPKVFMRFGAQSAGGNKGTSGGGGVRKGSDS